MVTVPHNQEARATVEQLVLDTQGSLHGFARYIVRVVVEQMYHGIGS